jgi:hypothetical protein
MHVKPLVKLFVPVTLLIPLMSAVCSVASPQSSDDGLVLHDRENAIFWSGTATTAPPNGQQPYVCTNTGVTCAEFDLTIDLPLNTWD